jgi:hypothetical protein
MSVVTLLLDYTPFLRFNTFPQGRYLFPALAAIAALLVSGLAQWLPMRYDKHGTVVALALMIALQAWSWGGVIVPYFYR